MSGGHLTDYRHNLGDMLDWARGVEKDNPLFAEQLRDVYKLLDRYDYYLSGDIGKDGIRKAWEEYTAKWSHMDNEKVRQIMFEKCMNLCETVIKGYNDDRDDLYRI